MRGDDLRSCGSALARGADETSKPDRLLGLTPSREVRLCAKLAVAPNRVHAKQWLQKSSIKSYF